MAGGMKSGRRHMKGGVKGHAMQYPAGWNRNTSVSSLTLVCE